MTRSAPYRHSDGSNCWTKNCSRGHSSGSSDLLKGLERKIQFYSEKAASVSVSVVDDGLEGIVRTGAQLREEFSFVTSLTTEFNLKRFKPVKNFTDSLSWTKPHGGLWLATVDEDGTNSWSSFLGGPSSTPTYSVEFDDSAHILVIDSKEDYLKALDAYPHYPEVEVLPESVLKVFSDVSGSAVNRDGTAKRALDYEKLASRYDAVLVTWNGLYKTGRESVRNTMGSDVSLTSWDIESAFVLRPAALKVSPAS